MGRTQTSVLPWLTTDDRDDLGGLIATRGLYYQYLYVLRLMSENLSGQCSGFEKEGREDFLSWGGASETSTEYVRLIQVKSKTAGCYLRLERASEIKKMLAHFIRSVSGLSSRLTDPDVTINCRLVYNAVPGHDCQAEECGSRLARFSEFRLLGQKLQELSRFDRLSSPLELEPFLPIPCNREAVLQELQFIEAYVPGLSNELNQVDRIADFIRSVFGLVVPYYEGVLKGTAEDHSIGQIPLSQLIHTRSDTIAVIKDAVETVLRKRELKDTQGHQDTDIARAEERARIEILAAQTRTNGISETTSAQLPIPNEDAIHRALAVHYSLDSGGQSSDLTFAEHAWPWSDHGYLVLLAKIRDNLMPVRTYLQRRHVTHRERVQLLFSFAQFISSIGAKGISLMNFRCDHLEFRDWYFVEEHESGPRFFLGDLAVLSLIPNDTALLRADWTQGPIVARALRFLYYGTDDPSLIRNTRIYRAKWNDNVVLDLADWLDDTPFISSLDLTRNLESLFEDEMHHWPIVYCGVHQDFIEDIVNNGINSLVDAVAGESVRPSALLEDRDRRRGSVYYALWREAQIGLLLNSQRDSVTLGHYNPYLTRRLAGTRERDQKMATSIRPESGRNHIILAGVSQSEQIRPFVSDMFGISYPRYVRWLRERFDQAHRQLLATQVPMFLRPDATFVERQRSRLDTLQSIDIPYELEDDTANHSSAGGLIALRITSPDDFQAALRRAQYNYSECIGLTMCEEFRQDIGVIEEITEHDHELTLRIRVAENPASLASTGLLRLRDKGSENVLLADDAMVREMKYVLGHLPVSSDRPAARAWRHVSEYLENSRRDLPTALQPSFDSDSEPDSVFTWQFVTGAAGTGKTRYVAQHVDLFLRSSSQNTYPPTRVLVVAASHFALENFLDEFRSVSDNKHEPFRYLPQARISSLKRQGRINQARYDQSESYYEKTFRNMLGSVNPITLSADKDQSNARAWTYSAQLQSRLRDIQESVHLRQPHHNLKRSILIPSHERWRAAHWQTSRSRPTSESSLCIETLKRRIETVEEMPEQTEPEGDLRGFSDSAVRTRLWERDACFAAPMVVTTIDALNNLPDVPYNLIVFEEASQIRPLKFLKVITKVIRANGGGGALQIISSGDPQQLPPFIEPSVYTDDLRIQSICDLYQDRKSDQAVVLTEQHRMQPEIAELVRALFYPQQQWEITREQKIGGVFWVDTSGLPSPAQKEEGSTSWYNPDELDVVSRLVSSLLSRGLDNILVVSPYLAQVDMLIDRLEHLQPRVQVRTVDGCQGRTADAVIVSFVSLDPTYDLRFVFDPKRMNVAMSRARDYLYLVGHLDNLIEGSESQELASQFPHVARLASFFGSSGAYRSNVLDPVFET